MGYEKEELYVLKKGVVGSSVIDFPLPTFIWVTLSCACVGYVMRMRVRERTHKRKRVELNFITSSS